MLYLSLDQSGKPVGSTSIEPHRQHDWKYLLILPHKNTGCGKDYYIINNQNLLNQNPATQAIPCMPAMKQKQNPIAV